MDGDIPGNNDGSSDNDRVQQGHGASTSSPSSSTIGVNKRESSQPNPSDNFEGDGDSRGQLLSCPYCYEEYEIGVLCSHLEDEHCYESKVAVCPICSNKVLKDMAGHISLQHSQLFKIQRRRRSRRAGAPPTSNATISLLCRELREFHLQAFLGPPPPGGPLFPPDPILSTIMSSPDNNDQECSSLARLEQVAAGLSPEERNDRLKEAGLRAKFVQELVISTLYR